MTDKTIEVEGHFGPKRVTRDKFISIWTAHASELVCIGMNVIDEARVKAGEKWDRLYAKEQSQ